MMWVMEALPREFNGLPGARYTFPAPIEEGFPPWSLALDILNAVGPMILCPIFRLVYRICLGRRWVISPKLARGSRHTVDDSMLFSCEVALGVSR